jgi:hypothetical protein
MPKLTDERRKQWEDNQRKTKEFWDMIESKYHRKQKRHAECRLCGDMITVIEPNDVYEELTKHEQAHPEYNEWKQLYKDDFGLFNLHEILHDHDCIFVKCSCLCGCKTDICVADMPEDKRKQPMLCEMCSLYQNRGHVEHRLQNE